MNKKTKINWRMKRFLEALSDGKWHRKLPPKKLKGVGFYTIVECYDQYLIKIKKIKVCKGHKSKDDYCIRIAITNKGKTALKRANR